MNAMCSRRHRSDLFRDCLFVNKRFLHTGAGSSAHPQDTVLLKGYHPKHAPFCSQRRHFGLMVETWLGVHGRDVNVLKSRHNTPFEKVAPQEYGSLIISEIVIIIAIGNPRCIFYFIWWYCKQHLKDAI